MTPLHGIGPLQSSILYLLGDGTGNSFDYSAFQHFYIWSSKGKVEGTLLITNEQGVD